PGAGIGLPSSTGTPELAAEPRTWAEILVHTVPDSIVDAMARNDVLQIVVFAVLFAVALSLVGEKGRPLVALCEALTETMFKLTDIVMRYAPLGVAAAIAYTVGHGGLRVLWNLAWLVGTLYVALVAFLVLVLLPAALLFRVPVAKLARAIKEP